MRQVKIYLDKNMVEIAGDGNQLLCPLQNRDEKTEGIDTFRDYVCYKNCAWFRIEEKYGEGTNKDTLISRIAYCGDKLIGEIKK